MQEEYGPVDLMSSGDERDWLVEAIDVEARHVRVGDLIRTVGLRRQVESAGHFGAVEGTVFSIASVVRDGPDIIITALMVCQRDEEIEPVDKVRWRIAENRAVPVFRMVCPLEPGGDG